MKFRRLLLSCLLLSGVTVSLDAQQLPNADFEGGWVDCKPWTSNNSTKVQGTTPSSWCISNVSGANGNTGATTVGDKVTGFNSSWAAKVYNVELNYIIYKATVPGYLTLGTTWSTSKMTSNKDGGTFGGIDFTNRPDAVSFWYQGNTSGDATVVAYMWAGQWQQENVPGNIVVSGNATTVTMINRDRNILGIKHNLGGTVTSSSDAKLIAKFDNKFNATADIWTEKTVDFTYEDAETVPAKFNIIFAAGDYWSDSPAKNNTLSVDDVKLLYYSRLSDLKVGDNTVPGFDSKVYNYNILEAADADPAAVTYTTLGGSPVKTVSIAKSEAANDILVKVTNNEAGETAVDYDGAKEHTYTIGYMDARYDGYLTASHQNPEGVDLIIEDLDTPTTLFTKKNADGTWTLILKDVAYGNYGTIAIDGIESTSTDGLSFAKTERTMTVNGQEATVTIEGYSDHFVICWNVTINGERKVLVFTDVYDTDLSGVNAIEGYAENIVAVAGGVELSAVNGKVGVYTIDGRLAAETVVRGNAHINLANGVYIVKTANNVKKVIVK